MLTSDIKINPFALRKAKIVCNFGLSECNRFKGSRDQIKILQHSFKSSKTESKQELSSDSIAPLDKLKMGMQSKVSSFDI